MMSCSCRPRNCEYRPVTHSPSTSPRSSRKNGALRKARSGLHEDDSLFREHSSLLEQLTDGAGTRRRVRQRCRTMVDWTIGSSACPAGTDPETRHKRLVITSPLGGRRIHDYYGATPSGYDFPISLPCRLAACTTRE
jgi:hypothetical protein